MYYCIIHFNIYNSNKESTVDVIKSLLATAHGNFPMYGDQVQLQNVLKYAIDQTDSGLHLIFSCIKWGTLVQW